MYAYQPGTTPWGSAKQHGPDLVEDDKSGPELAEDDRRGPELEDNRRGPELEDDRPVPDHMTPQHDADVKILAAGLERIVTKIEK